MTLTIYHNPRCTKSRQTLELLQSKGFKPQTIEYLKNPPSAAELKEILKKLGLKAQDVLRTKEDVYTQLGIQNKSLTEDELISLTVENPVLLERPIVVNGPKAAIGRPPENVLKIL